MNRAAVALTVLAVATTASAGPGEVVRVEDRDVTAPPMRGPKLAPVTIELFFSPSRGLKGPYARVEKLQAAHAGRVRILYRVVGRSSDRLPSAVLEAQAEGLFFEMMAAINDSALPSQVSEDKILELGRRVGVDPAKLVDAVRREPFDDVLGANQLRENQRATGARGDQLVVLINGKLASSPDNDPALERDYVEAYAHATDLLDRGVPPERLFEALDAEANVREVDVVPNAREIDWADRDVADVLSDALASPPVDTHGLPSFGPSDAALTITVLCDPFSPLCTAARSAATSVVRMLPGCVRIAWEPYAGLDDPAHTRDIGMVSDAAFCAEQLGTNADDAHGAESAGWVWLDRIALEANHRTSHVSSEALVDRVAQRLGIDGRKLAACRARVAGITVARSELAHASGVHTSPATVVGGRIYPGLKDAATLQKLVENELAPGVLDSAAPWTRPAR